FDDSKMRGAADRCRRQTLKEKLSPYFWVFGILEGLFARPNDPRPVHHGGGVELAPLQPQVTRRFQRGAVETRCASAAPWMSMPLSLDHAWPPQSDEKARVVLSAPSPIWQSQATGRVWQ